LAYLDDAAMRRSERSNLRLVVLAAGRGTRFGGFKQWAVLPGLGRTLLEFNLIDAAHAGFSRIVLVLHPEGIEAVQTRLLPRLRTDQSIELCVQRLGDLPAGYAGHVGSRRRPWGTGHALWATRNVCQGPFAVINADDYYGPQSFQLLAGHMRQSSDWCVVTYRLAETLSPHGGVNRALCEIDREGYLQAIEEWTGISLYDGMLRGVPPHGQVAEIAADREVSMNAWGFGPDLFDLLEKGLSEFLSGGPKEDAEYHLPDQIHCATSCGAARVKVLKTTERWLGVTYNEDLLHVRDELACRLGIDLNERPGDPGK
jgi:NDP-sugar pyrophosphorylase family protein